MWTEAQREFAGEYLVRGGGKDFAAECHGGGQSLLVSPGRGRKLQFACEYLEGGGVL